MKVNKLLYGMRLSMPQGNSALIRLIINKGGNNGK